MGRRAPRALSLARLADESVGRAGVPLREEPEAAAGHGRTREEQEPREPLPFRVEPEAEPEHEQQESDDAPGPIVRAHGALTRRSACTT